MKRWEYKIARIEYLGKKLSEFEAGLDDSAFNELGEEGWELVSVFLETDVVDSSQQARAFFKREKKK